MVAGGFPASAALRHRAAVEGLNYSETIKAYLACQLELEYALQYIMQVLDAAIVIAGLYVFGLRATLYAVVSVFVMTKVSDAFLEGFKNSKAAFIITNRYKEVADRIMEDLDRGVTGLQAKGMYTGDSKCVLYCVVSRKEIVEIKKIVNEADPGAFVIVSDVREVLGEGFLEYSDGF